MGNNDNLLFTAASKINRLAHLRSNANFIKQLVHSNNSKLILFKKEKYNQILANESFNSIRFFNQSDNELFDNILKDWSDWNDNLQLVKKFPNLNVIWLGLVDDSNTKNPIITPNNEKFNGLPLFALDISNYLSLFSPLLSSDLNLKWISSYLEFINFSNEESTLFAYANSLMDYIQKHKFCPVCASDLITVDGGTRLKCLKNSPLGSQCDVKEGNNVLYPRIDPVVIVALYNAKGEVLLGHNKRRHSTRNMYSCFSGFMEPGESFELTCQREVYEETGININIEDIKLIKSQPWPFPANLMVGCIAFVKNFESQTIRCDLDDELDDIRWFSKNEIISGNGEFDDGRVWFLPPGTSIANKLIHLAVNQTITKL